MKESGMDIIIKLIDSMSFNELLEASGYVKQIDAGVLFDRVKKNAEQSSEMALSLVEYLEGHPELVRSALELVNDRVNTENSTSKDVDRYRKKVDKEQKIIEQWAQVDGDSIEGSSRIASLVNLSDYYIEMGKYNNSLRCLMEAYDNINFSNDDNTQFLGKIMSNLGSVYRYKGNLNEAIRYQEQAIHYYNERRDTSALASAYNDLALTYQDMGDYEKALSLLNAAKAAIVESNDAELASINNNIASILVATGKYVEAIDYYKYSLSIKEEAGEQDSLSFAATYNNLAGAYKSIGCFELALNCVKKAIEIYTKNLRSDHPTLAASYNNIATIYQELGDIEKAEYYLLKALKIREKALGSAHIDTANTYGNLAAVYQAKGDYDRALCYYMKALEVSEFVLGSEHPSIGILYNNIGGLYLQNGEIEKAASFIHRAYKILSHSLGPEHPYTKDLYEMLTKLGLIQQ